MCIRDRDEALIESVLRKASQTDEGWNKEFLNILRSGMNGDASTEGKMISQNFVHSMLLNESVYMPVLHLMLPMMVDGDVYKRQGLSSTNPDILIKIMEKSII